MKERREFSAPGKEQRDSRSIGGISGNYFLTPFSGKSG